MTKRFNILSLSGGGYLGLYTIAVLSQLEEELGRPIASSFDLIAGTSIGGIIALGLAHEVKAKVMEDAFLRDGSRIFSDRPVPTGRVGQFLDILRYILKPKYDPRHLRTTITDLVGAETKIGDLRHRVLVPTVNLTKGGPQVFKTPHHATFTRDQRLRVADVAMATSAAPTYFPIAEVEHSLYADGGLFANSPDSLAVHEAEHFLDVEPKDVHVMSIGTTTSSFSFADATGRRLGIYGWAKDQRLVSVILASQQKVSDYMLGHRLGSRYLRLDTEQSPDQTQHLALDVATESAQRTIRGLATATVRANINSPVLRGFFEHRAPDPHFPGKSTSLGSL
ncbi:CBASS cGAMP-activated phospholipase [Sinorhizobium medicae]|uniref:CBASS cGAMP-activated phospholipase n=2 Tax=Sinorhizobium medicae TaxID=110321 RepID=UPI000C7D4A0D|nr:CBASS cGAMP-activated phospholipase [Sinorhizobium medicae]MDX0518900.1 patatin [Sinorhizobium medicae]MDX0729309.1 patatin [Sinorhizobium medicae]MDX0735540.1 patatin [Sinorhizobium medicae]MDX0815540.1 patatin [Sinorhizobium medicae]PLU46322.1 patatin [Sinorhizobium medicae]